MPDAGRKSFDNPIDSWRDLIIHFTVTADMRMHLAQPGFANFTSIDELLFSPICQWLVPLDFEIDIEIMPPDP